MFLHYLNVMNEAILYIEVFRIQMVYCYKAKRKVKRCKNLENLIKFHF